VKFGEPLLRVFAEDDAGHVQAGQSDLEIQNMKIYIIAAGRGQFIFRPLGQILTPRG
jgi:hypothetical protein